MSVKFTNSNQSRQNHVDKTRFNLSVFRRVNLSNKYVMTHYLFNHILSYQFTDS